MWLAGGRPPLRRIALGVKEASVEVHLRPVASRARFAVVAFVLTLAVLAASVWHDFALLGLAGRIAAGQAGQALQVEAASLDQAEVLIAGAYVVAVIVTAVAFCMWVHRSYANLVTAGVSGLRYTARRAVEGFFIPFVNLVRPFRVVNELWGASRNLAAGAALVPADAQKNTHWAVGIWWISMLLGNGYARITSAMLDAARTAADFEQYARQSLVADGVMLIAAAMAVMIVRTISGWQESARMIRGTDTPVLTPN